MNKKNKPNSPYKKTALIGALSVCLLGIVVIAGMLYLKKDTASQDAQAEAQLQRETQDLKTIQKQSETEIQTETLSLSETEPESLTENETDATTEEQTESEQETVQPESGDGPIVAIDAGHQGPGQDMSQYEPIGPGASETKLRLATGTQGRTTGLYEYELDLTVSLLLKQELIERGYQVIMTRETHDINIGNIERAEIANEAGADIMVRIHANGSDDTSVNGALTMSPSAVNPYVGSMYQECYQLSRCIVDAYCEATGLNNDGILEVDNMTGINWCQMPVTIVEMGFMTNAEDDVYMADSENQNTMAVGIANGIDQYFGRQ